MLEKLAEKMTLKVSISNETVIRVMTLVLAFFLGLQLLYELRPALTLLAVAFFLALALNPPVSYLARRLPGGSRALATAVSYLAVISALALVIYATVPPLVSQSKDFFEKFPTYAEELKHGNGILAKQVDTFGLEDDIERFQSEYKERVPDAGGPIFNLFQRISANVLSVLTVFVLAFFMLVEGPQWLRRFNEMQPKSKREHRTALLNKMHGVVTGYVNGQLLVAFIGGVTALTAMSVLKLFGIEIPFIIPMAAIIFLTGLIPLIGNTLGAIVVVGVSLFSTLLGAIIMAVFFLVYQQIENNAIQPVIQSKAVELSPLLILVAAILGVTLAGFLGALLAIPVAGCIKVLLYDSVEERRQKAQHK